MTMQPLKPLAERKRTPKKLEPMFDRVLLELIQPKQVHGAMIISANITEREVRLAKVVALGPGKLIADSSKYVKTHLKPGDLVYFNQIAGNPVSIPDEYDFVVLGAGHVADESHRGTMTDGQLVRSVDGPDLILNRDLKYQLQTEDAIYMLVG